MTPSPRKLSSRSAGDKVRELPEASIPDDESLVLRARSGDRWAEEALYRRHVAYIAGMVLRLLGRSAEAEDVVQDTFAIGLDQIGAVREPSSIRAWFGQIAVSQVRRRLRRLKLLSRLGFYPPIDHVELEELAVQEADAETRAELAEIGTVLAELSTNERLAWMLRYVEGESLKNVALLCGCSLATAKRRVLAASTHLRRRGHSLEVPP
jgi:RNA polymerase sigma-70 factor, ECF subfamily